MVQIPNTIELESTNLDVQPIFFISILLFSFNSSSQHKPGVYWVVYCCQRLHIFHSILRHESLHFSDWEKLNFCWFVLPALLSAAFFLFSNPAALSVSLVLAWHWSRCFFKLLILFLEVEGSLFVAHTVNCTWLFLGSCTFLWQTENNVSMSVSQM